MSKKISVKNLVLLMVIVSMMTGLWGSITFEGYVSSSLVVCVILTHFLLLYVLSSRKLSSIFRPEDKAPVKKREKDLDYKPKDLDRVSDRELLQMERELFRITIEQKTVPKVNTKELKEVRQAIRERGLEGAYD